MTVAFADVSHSRTVHIAAYAHASHDRVAMLVGQGTTLSATELLLGATEGSRSAWEEIVRRYGNLVWAKVRSFRLQDADARDAVQMTWLRLAENCHRVQHPERLAGWLATTAHRECLRIIHQEKRTANHPAVVVENLADPSAGPEQRVLDADTAQMLRALLDKLPPRGRTLLQALFADNPRPYAEVARATGTPTGSIGPTRARALQQLRRMIDEHGITESWRS
jgi:RNA polymerase sigma factor (sigma-70 family)